MFPNVHTSLPNTEKYFLLHLKNLKDVSSVQICFQSCDYTWDYVFKSGFFLILAQRHIKQV